GLSPQHVALLREAPRADEAAGPLRTRLGGGLDEVLALDAQKRVPEAWRPRLAERPGLTGVVDTTAPPGLLRGLVLFHEREALGAGISVLRVAGELERYGWSPSGWVPGDGPLRTRAEEQLVAVEGVGGPLSFRR